MKTPDTEKRYSLRALEPEDVDFMFLCETDRNAFDQSDYVAPLSRRMLSDYALSYDADPFHAGQLRLVIEDTTERRPVGLADLYNISAHDATAMAGIIVHPDRRRRGIATEALRQLAGFCRHTLHLDILAAIVDVTNTPSIRLFDKAGFTRAAVIPRWRRLGDSRNDVIFYSLDLMQ